ncbi:hypothetical protein CF8_0170 [Aeromonas phage CF8]|nr:hypothetical protein CF8_0170 [Aeromonas phage CF8]
MTTNYLRISPTRFVVTGSICDDHIQVVPADQFKQVVKDCGLKSTWSLWFESGYFPNDTNVVVIVDLLPSPPMNRQGTTATGEEILGMIERDEFNYSSDPFNPKYTADGAPGSGIALFQPLGKDAYHVHREESYFGQYLRIEEVRELVDVKAKDWRIYFNSEVGKEAGVIIAKEIPYTNGAQWADLDQTFNHFGEVIDYLEHNKFLSDWIKGENKQDPVPYLETDWDNTDVKVTDDVFVKQVTYTKEEVLEIIRFLRPDLDADSNMLVKLLHK